MKLMVILAALLSGIALFGVANAKTPSPDPSCEAGSSVKTLGYVNAIALTGVGGPESQTLSIRLSDNGTYYPRADASAGVFAGYVALFASAYANQKPVTIYYGCEVGMRVIHSVELP